MYIDSHCHLNFPQLKDNLPQIFSDMDANQVTHALCVSVNLPDWPEMLSLVESSPRLWASVGVHPDYEDTPEASPEMLVDMASHPKVVAIGETGLDYYRREDQPEWQKQRFRDHIQAARQTDLPLIIHTRASAADTIDMIASEGRGEVRGVMHCFTEDWDNARKALDLGFYISISGIVTFKNAPVIQDVASKVPLDRLLIETDSPYLAPVPFRGKLNDPSKVRYVAEKIAALRNVDPALIGEATRDNFYNLFNKIAR
ncbi:MAG: putative metal-dependent hydrolase YcfH [Kerstersia gyiorum]|uniref:TatD family hydrolase n=1 Tax=Kerstersia gyiorum TaxID=206506 RepID=UPI0030CB5B39